MNQSMVLSGHFSFGSSRWRALATAMQGAWRRLIPHGCGFLELKFFNVNVHVQSYQFPT